MARWRTTLAASHQPMSTEPKLAPRHSEDTLVNTLQAWLAVGAPALALAAGLFAGRSVVRSAVGYLVLVLTLLFFLVVPRSPVSAGVVGSIAFLLVASGRGETEVETRPYGHDVPERVDDPNIPEPRRV